MKSAKYFREDAEGQCLTLAVQDAPRGGPVRLSVRRGVGSATARPGFSVPRTTKSPGNNSNVICPCCETVVSGERVRAQLAAQRGGCEVIFDAQGARVGGAVLLAVGVVDPITRKRSYRSPTMDDYRSVWLATKTASDRPKSAPPGELNPVRPSPNARGVTAPTRYGVKRFSELFTSRQRLALSTLAGVIQARASASPEPNALSLGLVLALGRAADQSSSLVRWVSGSEFISSSFPRQALQMTWDFVESVPCGEESANYRAAVEWIAKVIEEELKAGLDPGDVLAADARASPLPDAAADTYFTDPPYYDAVPYADLSDFFLIWLKEALPASHRRVLNFPEGGDLAPKEAEAVWNQAHTVDGKPKGPEFFERAMNEAFAEGRRLLKTDGVGCVVFAHKTTEGWEALLGGLLSGGWVVGASWPVATERAVRTNAQETASLASSVHLVCRPRASDAPIGDWADVARELPLKVRAWMSRLDKEGVRGADLVFACIGPAMEVYSRYSRVVDAEDREIPLGGDPEASEPYKQGYLAKVWEVVGRLALEQVLGKTGGEGSALEEDARLTALFLWALQSTNGNGDAGGEADADEADAGDDEEEGGGGSGKKKGFTLPYDVVRRFAQPLGIHLETWEGRIAETEKGVVRLLPVSERMTQLFGTGGAEAAAEELESSNVRGGVQLTLFPDEPMPPSGVPAKKKGPTRAKGKALRDNAAADRSKQVTTLDRVHAAMLLQQSGQTAALRSLLADERRRGPDFERLANALAALYPKGSDERRLVEAMLLAMPR